MMAYLWIALGGAVGSVARFWVSNMVTVRVGQSFPWNTLVVNVTGSFLIGLLAVLAGAEGRLQPPARALAVQFLMIGLCGGYTTFSTFSLQTLAMMQEGRWLPAFGNMVLSIALCLLGTWLGWAAGQMFNR